MLFQSFKDTPENDTIKKFQYFFNITAYPFGLTTDFFFFYFGKFNLINLDYKMSIKNTLVHF